MGEVPIEAAKKQIIENEPASPEHIAVTRLSTYQLQWASLCSASLSYSSVLPPFSYPSIIPTIFHVLPILCLSTLGSS